MTAPLWLAFAFMLLCLQSGWESAKMGKKLGDLAMIFVSSILCWFLLTLISTYWVPLCRP